MYQALFSGRSRGPGYEANARGSARVLGKRRSDRLVLLRRFSVRVHRVRGTNLGCNAVCCKLHISQRLLSETRTNEKRYVLTFSRPRFYTTSFYLSRVTAQFIMETSFVSYDSFQIIVVAQLESKWRPKYGLSQLSL